MTTNQPIDHIANRRSAIVEALARTVFGLQRFVPQNVCDLESHVIEFLAFRIGKGDFDDSPISELTELLAESVSDLLGYDGFTIDDLLPYIDQRTAIYAHVHASSDREREVLNHLDRCYNRQPFRECYCLSDIEERLCTAAVTLDLLKFAKRIRESLEVADVPDL
jgi:hypothetical protein